MKKRIVSAFLALVLALSLAGTAFAAAETTVTPGTFTDGKTVTAALSTDKKYIDLTVTGLTSGGQYMVFMVSGIHADPNAANITETTLKCIDQAQADGSVTFKVYPSSMQNSTILISGTDMELTIVATVNVPYVVGDVTGDTKVNIRDVVALAQKVAASASFTGDALAVADITGDGKVNIRDVVALAQRVARG